MPTRDPGSRVVAFNVNKEIYDCSSGVIYQHGKLEFDTTRSCGTLRYAL